VLAIKNTDIAAHLKLPPVKLHCSMLAEDAIRASVNDWKAKKEAKKAAAWVGGGGERGGENFGAS
jgi:NifU-like protein involved in Fe-S cluster formation